jgi:aspartate carbamoyltransferase catalytic subunit
MAQLSFAPAGNHVRIARASAMRKPRPEPIKHLLSASELGIDLVDELCRAADEFEAGFASTNTLAGKTVALLFFQSSTRTRLGFEAATVALGASAIGFQDMSASRSNQRVGESIEDCAAVVSRLCDAIVVRHHEVGAAARMAAKSVAPVINAGDGWNEHPTQALIDVYAMRRGLGTIRGKSIAFGGDPRGRVIRSLIQLLRSEAPREIVFCPPPHYPVPGDVLSAISENQISYRFIQDIERALIECDAITMAPYDMSEIGEPAASSYVSPHDTREQYVITPEKIERTRSKALLYHPLPRFEEIDPACDTLPNAMYFEQVRLSKFMRMAVLDRLLGAG